MGDLEFKIKNTLEAFLIAYLESRISGADHNLSVGLASVRVESIFPDSKDYVKVISSVFKNNKTIRKILEDYTMSMMTEVAGIIISKVSDLIAKKFDLFFEEILREITR